MSPMRIVTSSKHLKNVFLNLKKQTTQTTQTQVQHLDFLARDFALKLFKKQVISTYITPLQYPLSLYNTDNIAAPYNSPSTTFSLG